MTARFRLPRVIALAFRLAVGVAVFCGAVARGENFKVESKVFVGNEEQPASTSTTIFYDGIVYDYLEMPPETIVFDKARRRFVILDPVRRLRTELSTDEVEGLANNLRKSAAGHNGALLRWLGNPKFDQSLDEKTQEIVFEGPYLTYRVASEPADPRIVEQYREFSDWFVQLNARLNPAYRQAFARMVVNDAIARRGEIPEKVHLTVQSQPLSKKTTRSEHQFVKYLVEADRNRVAQTDQFMAIFQRVDFSQYQSPRAR